MSTRGVCRQCGHLTAKCAGCGKRRRKLYKWHGPLPFCYRCAEAAGMVGRMTVAHPVNRQGQPI
jgi:hypothetical protein